MSSRLTSELITRLMLNRKIIKCSQNYCENYSEIHKKFFINLESMQCVCRFCYCNEHTHMITDSIHCICSVVNELFMQ